MFITANPAAMMKWNAQRRLVIPEKYVATNGDVKAPRPGLN